MIEIFSFISNMSSEHSGSCCHSVSQAACQDLNEMDFERGIWSAALNGELKRITEMLNKGIDPSVPDRYGFTALHYAARNGKIEACQLLLKKNANVNAQTNFGATPLHRAAYQGQTEICKLLLDHKANPSIADSDGKTPLHKAAENGHLNVVKLLIEKDANLKYVRDKSFRVPQDYVDPDKNKELYDILFYFEEAAENHHLNVVKLLLEQDVNLKYVRDKSFRVAQSYVVDPDKDKELYDILFHFDLEFEDDD